MRRGHRFADFGFDCGFPPFGFRVWGPWHFRPWRFPRREEYLRMLEEYKQELEEELREVEQEIEELKKGG